MRRESRMLLTVGGLGFGAVLVLGMMAQRYGTVVTERVEAQEQRETRRDKTRGFRTGGRSTPAVVPVVPRPAEANTDESPDARAQRYVDAFLDVRRAMREALDEKGGAVSLAAQTEIARRARDGEIGRSWMAEHEYRQVLTIFRAWRESTMAPTEPFVRAFDERRGAVSRVNLGRLEELDL